MRRSRWFPTLALLGALALVTAACGQKAGVHLAASGGRTVDANGNPIAVDANGNPVAVDANGNPVEVGGTTSGGGGSSSTQTRTGGGGGGGTTSGDSGGGGVNSTKVWGKTITIGIHAPITGAAPLPSTFQAAADFVKGWVNNNVKLPGDRKIDIQIVDDQYQPAVAAQKCQELVKQKNAFLLVGAAGTDQIQSCARYSAQVGVPYLSAGVTEKGLTTLKNYFAISMTYKAQGPYLAKFMKQYYPDRAADPSKVWMVYSDTPNFLDAVDSFTKAFPGVQTYKLPRVPNPTDLSRAASAICGAGGDSQIKLAYPLMAPKDWLILIGNQPTNCTPHWAGVGVTMGVNEVAENGCRTVQRQYDGSTFFNPVPGIDQVPTMDPQFDQATKAAHADWDDIYVALWNLAKGVVQLLEMTGADLTRAKFVTTTENAKNISTGLSPPLSFSPTNHFGAHQVHVLKARCYQSSSGTTGVYDTLAKFLEY